ncbi:hypothetical protein K1T35_45570 [Pseudonocardia sp. DSM 110487]|uniref:hypothetical protein n=1 Tax=Pseudonocardia sp. DSM 110487 TaxID=2865833 RepID=UPI001C69B488|nr:hypothetical protein [Pseudonocardia sp. DSM 110487]QYN35499.1 hypothetical protein K1T35_45570 [Pseudonocardia sp. DSM 110487]
MLADLFLGLIALGSAGLGVLASCSGEFGRAAFLLAVAVFFGAITALSSSMWLLRQRTSRGSVALERSGAEYDGIKIKFSAWPHCGLAVIMFMGFAFMAAHAAGWLLSWEMPSYLPRSDAFSGVVAAAGALFCLWLFIEFASGRIARGYLALTPTGIYHRSHIFEHYVPWSAVFEVSAVELSAGSFIAVNAFPAQGTHVRRTHWIGKTLEFRLLPYLMVRCRLLAVDPVLVYYALGYYFAHPDARAELLTPAGERRIRGGNVLG